MLFSKNDAEVEDEDIEETEEEKAEETDECDEKFAIRTKTYIGYCKVLTQMFRDGYRWRGETMDITEKDFEEFGDKTCITIKKGGSTINGVDSELKAKMDKVEKSKNIAEALVGIIEVVKGFESKGKEVVNAGGIVKGTLEKYEDEGYEIYSVNQFFAEEVDGYDSKKKESI